MPELSPDELARYSRHVLLGEIGIEGQRRLKASKVLVIGAGGLGSPASLYLAAAGVGTLGIVDFDRVETHNLQRQLLHDDRSVGEPKTASAARRLRLTNPFVTVVEHDTSVSADNAIELFRHYDVIVDGTDSFATRYLNNDAAVLARRPLVYGSVFKFEGSVSVFAPHSGGPCYRCLFPEPPAPGTVPNCADAGVLGALCGVIGSLQALEAIKLIAGFGETLMGQWLTYDALDQTFRRLALPRDPGCLICGQAPLIRELRAENYAFDCAVAPSAAPYPMGSDGSAPLEVSVEEAHRLLSERPDAVSLIDIREPYEMAICRIRAGEPIPMRQIPDRLGFLPKDKHLLIYCHTGLRSLRVTQYLRNHGFTAVSNVAGGIDAWAERIEPGMRRY